MRWQNKACVFEMICTRYSETTKTKNKTITQFLLFQYLNDQIHATKNYMSHKIRRLDHNVIIIVKFMCMCICNTMVMFLTRQVLPSLRNTDCLGSNWTMSRCRPVWDQTHKLRKWPQTNQHKWKRGTTANNSDWNQ